MPPIEVFRLGELHFVIDGHHRVSVARAQGDTDIDAYVREVQTKVPVSDELMLRDLLRTRHEREFDERVPLPPAARARIDLTEAWRYEQLSKHVESWAFRASQAEGRLFSRVAAAEAWFREEYEPIADALEELGIGGPGTETTRFLRVVLLRDLLLRTGGWSDALLEQLLDAIRGSAHGESDEIVQRILREVR
jgi:hypothetical protein